jgi:hypothetical protein
MRRRLVVTCALLLACAACSSSGSGASAGGTASATRPDTTRVSSTSVLLAAARTELKCSDQIGWPRAPSAGYSVVLGKVALPTGKALGAVRLHPSNPKSKYWAKQGLLVKPRTSFELIVPSAWASRLTIQWGNPGTPTTHLRVTGCRSKKAGAHWLAFAGGFTLSKPACVPLIVKTATEQRTVHIGAGKACAGQKPPPAPH